MWYNKTKDTGRAGQRAEPENDENKGTSKNIRCILLLNSAEREGISMGLIRYETYPKQILIGNVLLIVCCVFYLAWWLLAFRPENPVKGMRSGWLLLPAAVSGLLSVIVLLRGMEAVPRYRELYSGGIILWGGIAVYFILLAVTLFCFKRPVTTELLLIVGWAMLALAEINALYSCQCFSWGAAVVFIIVIGIAAVISLVCYVRYYHLDSGARYYDGMVPLWMAALVMLGITIVMVTRR